MSTRFSRERARKFDRYSFRDNPQARTYPHSFYLADGAGCLRLALDHLRDPTRALSICPTWTPEPAMKAARERYQDARAAFPKPACLLP
jgi:hypothetical protein